jgi:hypothetical protein
MTTHLSNVFSTEDLEYLTQSQEVLDAKTKLNNSNVVYFTIPVTPTICYSIFSQFGLDISNVSEIPMRWIKGDTAPHIDVGSNKFEKTYLAYLNDNVGDFIIDDASYPINANTGFVFNEGLRHMTQNTGLEPRLLLGPMNEFALQVGGRYSIYYFNNYDDAFNNVNSVSYGETYILGNSIKSINGGSIGQTTSWRVAGIYDNFSNITNSVLTGVYSNGIDLSIIAPPDAHSFNVYPSVPCFLEGTKVLTLIYGKEEYVPIETLQKGDQIKTSRDGYKKVQLIGKGDIQNPATSDRIENRLYKCSPESYPELKEDLYITGCHSILVDTITDKQREETMNHLGKIYITDKKYRLMACVDERAEPWKSEGLYNIWHIALENADEKMNYGIYVNGGLLVETCSINILKNHSNLKIQ